MTTCIFCCADVHVTFVENHHRWHEQNDLHGVDCVRVTQTNAHDQPTACTCGLLL